MNIKFENVQMHNFLSFEDAELSLSDNGFTLVKGVNLNVDDNALSNGSGKSSIWEAISWVLTGETIRGAKDVKRLGSEGTCSVTINFIADEVSYEITRTKDPSNLKLFVNGEDKSGKGIRDTQQILVQYLPDLTSSLIGSVIILGQGLPQRFTNNSPSGRKDVLEKLSKSDFMIEDLKQRITNRKNTLSSEQRKYEDAKLVATTKLNVAENNKKTAQTKKDTILNTNSEEILNTINSLTNSKTDLEEELKEHADLANQLRDMIESVSKDVYKYRAEVAEEKSKLQEEQAAEISPLKKTELEIRARITTLQQTIAKIKSIKDVCPTCGQKLPNVNKPTTEAEEAELEDIKKDLEAVLDSETYINDKYNNLISDSALKFSGKIKSAESQVNELKGQQSKVQQETNNISRQIQTTTSQINSLKKSVEDLESGLKLAEAAIENAEKDIITYNDEILYNTGELENINSHLDVINKMGNVITRDFRGYLLTNVIDYINKQSKLYAKDIFETDKINFVLNGNNISISYCDKEYESLSGGEKQKVDLIVQFAIRDMLCNFLDFSCNILVLDEIADNIDSIGAEKLFSTIATKINDVESIFIISHHQDFDMPVDKEIKIIKGEDGISRVE